MSVDSATKQIIKNAVSEYYRLNHINSTTKTSLDSYIDSVSRSQIEEVLYADLDQTESDVEITFNDAARTATNASGTDKSIVTNEIEISDCVVKALKINAATTEDVSWLLSKDGIDFYSVTGVNMCEKILSTESVWVKVTTPDNVIYSLTVVYENN